MHLCAHLNAAHRIIERGAHWLKPVVALLTRVTLGWIFFEAGMGKFDNLGFVAENFSKLGIPFPSVQAPFIASVEMFGGLLLILGLGTRLAASLLAATMIVALATAYSEYFTSEQSWSDLFGLSEFCFVLLFGWLVVHGSGKLSLDTVVVWWLKRMGPKEEPVTA
jgi:putative oxidoreductase